MTNNGKGGKRSGVSDKKEVEVVKINEVTEVVKGKVVKEKVQLKGYRWNVK